MAKGKRGSKSHQKDARSPGFASPRLRPVSLLPLRQIDDRRSFDFEPASRPARLFSGSVASIVAAPKIIKGKVRSSARVPYQIAFAAPRETLVCVRRKMRREVLHALGKKGKGGKGRRNKWSDVKC